ncbi:hypothetical protein H4R33_001308 [Dimargaris cristalligena]|nr:hypothetical protein H4R33_001308 [Dimargaris cristalligena]
MKSICFSTSLVGMLLAHYAMAFPSSDPTTAESPSQTLTGWMSRLKSSYNNREYPTLFGAPELLQDTMPSTFKNSNDDIQLKSLAKKSPEDLPQEIKEQVAQYLNTSDLGYAAQASKGLRELALADEDYRKRVYIRMIKYGPLPKWAVLITFNRRANGRVAVIGQAMCTELTLAAFNATYLELYGLGISPLGERLAETNDSGACEVLLNTAEFKSTLKKVYSDWCYVRLDQMDRNQLAKAFPSVETAIDGDIKQLWEITTQIIQLGFGTQDILPSLPHSSMLLPMFNPNKYPLGIQLNPKSIQNTFIRMIIGALVAKEDYKLLSEYIIEIQKRAIDEKARYFANIIALEWDLIEAKEVALAKLRCTYKESYQRATFFGYDHSATVLLNRVGSMDGVRLLEDMEPKEITACHSHYGTGGEVYIKRSTGGNNITKTSVSYLTLRSALPKELNLPESAFEVPAESEKLFDEWLVGPYERSAVLSARQSATHTKMPVSFPGDD